MSGKTQSCCGTVAADKRRYYPVPPVVSPGWNLSDHIGEIKARLDIGRMDYAVAPGIYAAGTPDAGSPVLVSANYKLSFDILRRELGGVDAWILVIDTRGVNVWCAAGKGTFGTLELSRRVALTGLEKIVAHRTLIVPQLGAPGIAAHDVQTVCGFRVVYGPVRARDIKRFLAGGMKADAAMRRVEFGAWDRLAVSWTEVALAMRPALIASAFLALAALLAFLNPVPAAVRQEVLALPILLWGAIFSGTVLNAVLLPYLPGKAFSFKGGILGAAVCAAIVTGGRLPLTAGIAMVLMGAAVSAFLALNFTGASTYTSLSGVKKEIKYSIPVIAGMLTAGAAMEIVHVARRLL